MKKVRLIITLFMCFAISSLSAMGQGYKSGFIITLDDDTVYGQIQDVNEREKALKCNFRADGQEVEYSPGEIKAYGFSEGNLYESHTITIKDDEKSLFLLCLVKGRANLYFFIDTDFEDYYFAQKGEPTLREIYVVDESFEEWDYEKSKNSIGTLTIMFNDCPDPKRKLTAASFHPNRIEDLFIDYNRCYGEGSISKAKKRKELKLIKGVEVGYSLSKLTFKSPYNFKTDDGFKSNQLNFGAVVGLGFPETRFSLLSGVYYGKYTWEATQFDLRKATSFNYTEYAFNFSYIKVPLAVKFIITRRKINPFIKAGGFMDFWISKETKQTLLRFMDPDYESSSKIEDFMDEPVEEELWTGEQGYLAGAGVEYKINEKMVIYFEVLYEGGNGVLKKTLSNTGTINFQIGFTF